MDRAVRLAVTFLAGLAVVLALAAPALAVDTLAYTDALRLAEHAARSKVASDAQPDRCKRRSRVRFRCRLVGYAGDVRYKGWVAVWNAGTTGTGWEIRARMVDEYCLDTRGVGCARIFHSSGSGPSRSPYSDAVG